MTQNEQVILDFCAAWSRLDVEALLEYFCEDGVYHNMPMLPVAGKAALRPFIGAFLKGWTSTAWEVINITSAGDVVIAERVDRTMVGDKAVNLPCCGVFEMRDGRISVWRDYFDMGTYTRALAS
ncbi:MAG: limonene-1,2-epoxide hydrolase family protein [Alphaproteobacteria bacterium]|nr:limonene-1,2-epoxide hydrolase family protein [Alphaproteobacteria bacterium]